MLRKVVLFSVAITAGAFGTCLRPSTAADWASILTAPAEDKSSWDPGRFLPSPRQLAYQENQLGAFVHFGLATFAATDAEYEAALHPANTPVIADPSRFNPAQLDAEQWVRAAKSMGARHLVFTAKHHDGFCLWPTKTTDHSVRNSPWKAGHGDVVREVAEACRKQGLPLGIYCSPADMRQACWAKPGDNYALVGNRDAYLRVYLEQLTELLTNYGEVVVVWIDTYCDPFCERVTDGKGNRIDSRPYEDAVVSLVRRLQPKAVVLHWGTARTDVRAVGNEDGTAPYPVWNVARKGQASNLPELAAEAEGWYLHECDIPTRPKWHWRPNSDGQLASVDRLMKAHDQSIGVGANILINMTPDARGLIPDAEMKRIAQFGATIRAESGPPLARTDTGKGWSVPGILELPLGHKASIERIVIEENIAFGQHVLQYVVEAKTDGQWKSVAQGESIGRKRIHRIDPAVAGEAIRLRVVKADAVPVIRELAAYSKRLAKCQEPLANDVCESTPLVFQGRRLLFGSRRVFGKSHSDGFEGMYLLLRDEADGRELARFGQHHSLGSAFVDGDTLHVFAADGPKNDWFQNIYHFSSTDLKNWKHELAIPRVGKEHLLNSSVCRDEQGYLMAYESDTPLSFCFKFARSKDLAKWEKIDGLVFAGPSGKEYSACPVIRYCKPYYYVIYLHVAIPRPQRFRIVPRPVQGSCHLATQPEESDP